MEKAVAFGVSAAGLCVCASLWIDKCLHRGDGRRATPRSTSHAGLLGGDVEVPVDLRVLAVALLEPLVGLLEVAALELRDPALASDLSTV